MAARITNDGMWRVTYGEEPDLSFEEVLERQPWKYEQVLPGKPKPDQYRIMNCRPYKAHQRVAESMRNGRFLLAGDAAHICSPL